MCETIAEYNVLKAVHKAHCAFHDAAKRHFHEAVDAECASRIAVMEHCKTMRLVELIEVGEVIACIKEIRRQTGKGLYEAKLIYYDMKAKFDGDQDDGDGGHPEDVRREVREGDDYGPGEIQGRSKQGGSSRTGPRRCTPTDHYAGGCTGRCQGSELKALPSTLGAIEGEKYLDGDSRGTT